MGQKVSAIVKNHFKDQEPPCFLSMGIVMLHEIHYPSRLVEYDVPGGAGLYATFGARLFKPGAQAKDVCCLIVVGRDFPYRLYLKIKSWNVTLDVHYVEDKSCTKARLVYRLSSPFRKIQTYITPPLKPTGHELDKSILLRARSFHLVGMPVEVIRLMLNIMRMRKEVGIEGRPLVVWEPTSAACYPGTLVRHSEVAHFADVFSPSYEDLYCLTVESRDVIPFRREIIEQQVMQLLNVGQDHVEEDRKSMIVVRCGHHGCYYRRSEEDKGWVRAIWTPGNPKLVDPTGSGSAFLGAFTVALLETDNLRAACLRGQVAASFAMEQYGPPKRTSRYKLIEHPYRLTREELWNNDDPVSRLRKFERELANEWP